MRVRIVLEAHDGRTAKWGAEVGEGSDERTTVIALLGAAEAAIHHSRRDLIQGDPMPWMTDPTRRTNDE